MSAPASACGPKPIIGNLFCNAGSAMSPALELVSGSSMTMSAGYRLFLACRFCRSLPDRYANPARTAAI